MRTRLGPTGEQLNRAHRVGKLVVVVDSLPHIPGVTAGQLLTALREQDDAFWASCASTAGISSPSRLTVECVLAIYQARAEAEERELHERLVADTEPLTSSDLDTRPNDAAFCDTGRPEARS